MSIKDAIITLAERLPEAGRSSLLASQPGDDASELDFPNGRLWKVKRLPKLRTIFQRRMIGASPEKTAWMQDCVLFVQPYVDRQKHPIWQAYFEDGTTTVFFLINAEKRTIIRSADYLEANSE